MTNNLNILKTKDSELWNKLFESGSSKSIYFHNDFISSTNCNYQYYLIHKNQELLAGFVGYTNSEDTRFIENSLAIYSGFYFSDRSNKKINKKRIERINVIQSLLEIIDKEYEEIVFSLSPDINDIRPFQWFNFDNKKDIYDFEIRYTSFLDLSKSTESLLEDLSTIRKQNIKYAEKENIEIVRSKDFSSLIQNYKSNLLQQSELLNKDYFENLAFLLDKLLGKDLIKIYELKRDKKLVYSAVFSDVGSTTEYMYGAGNKDLQQSYDGTYLIWSALKDLKSLGKTSVNFEGVNSPNRGNFKLSFGGNLKPYYKILKTIN